MSDLFRSLLESAKNRGSVMELCLKAAVLYQIIFYVQFEFVDLTDARAILILFVCLFACLFVVLRFS